MGLLITKAKPNPAGKDRGSRAFTPSQQLAGEWVDIQNNGTQPLSLNDVKLYHWAYTTGTSGEWKKVMGFSGMLGSMKTVRVHSGREIPLAHMNYINREGVEHHLFTGKNYVWNNAREDKPRLWHVPSEQWIDKTSYEAYPPEGKILKRVSLKLV
ncbi:hypothetical protein A3F52_00855 [Candidatus Uhrbacteria bacterium RIFCSPHIGHO2_12_FULL_47_11]|nr:MAG: hypothetical protein A3F52_00855 [Candidatus Uhrbacteria bacterium RIFCSPHIGHO2_12_FULL_47_11]